MQKSVVYAVLASTCLLGLAKPVSAAPVVPEIISSSLSGSVRFSNNSDLRGAEVVIFGLGNPRGPLNNTLNTGIIRPRDFPNSLTSASFSGSINDNASFFELNLGRSSVLEGSPASSEPFSGIFLVSTFQARVANTETFAQDFTLTLDIPQLHTSLANPNQSSNPNLSPFAFPISLSASVSVNQSGINIFEKGFSAEKSSNSFASRQLINGRLISDNVCNGFLDPVSECITSSLSTTIALGTFDPGASTQFEVSVVTLMSSFANGDDYDILSAAGQSALVRLGDVNNPFRFTVNATPTAAQLVSAPASLALFGAGLAGLAMLRRRRRAV